MTFENYNNFKKFETKSREIANLTRCQDQPLIGAIYYSLNTTCQLSK